jgi:hypothetical protein
MTGSHSLIEDSDGKITTVSFYGLMDPVTPHTANQIVPKGTRVIIIEPYFKRAADGTLTIRVDDPSDVIFDGEQPRPKTTLEFKEEAAKLYLAENYKEAIICFKHELDNLLQ